MPWAMNIELDLRHGSWSGAAELGSRCDHEDSPSLPGEKQKAAVPSAWGRCRGEGFRGLSPLHHGLCRKVGFDRPACADSIAAFKLRPAEAGRGDGSSRQG